MLTSALPMCIAVLCAAALPAQAGAAAGSLGSSVRPAADRVLPALREERLRLDTSAPGHDRDLALTLDACSGRFDAALIDLLVRERIPATLFVTGRWLRANAAAVALLRQHPQLFELEDHGSAHRPLVVAGRLYGLAGVADAAGADDEVTGAARAIEQATGRPVRWFRGAGAAYDDTGRAAVQRAGLRIAGYSLNGDDGAHLGAAGVARRLASAQAGDVILAHMNHPGSGIAAGLAKALPALRQRGLRFVRLSDVAGVQVLPPVAVGRR